MPWSRVLAFDDPFPCQMAIQAADVELFPTSKGKFSSELTQIRMDRLWMQRFHLDLPQISTVSIRPGRRAIGFLTRQSQPGMQHCGMEVLPGAIIVNNFDVLHQRSGADFHYGSMSMPTDDFDAACEGITNVEFGKLPTHFVQPTPVVMSRLMKLHEMVGQMAKTTPDLLELPEVARALEQNLIHLLVKCLTEGALSERTVGSRRHDVIVAKFEDFLEAHPDMPLYLTEICAAIGVAERTLRAACEEHLGMGPIRYLSLRRMHLVRRALLRANSSMATVTQVATDHGFWELGRFSVAYRTLFGELPSESLRRPPEDPKIFLNRPSLLTTSTYQ
jgi:AraC-like DNA-binding protein